MSAHPDHFFRAFERCLQNRFSDSQALIMAEGYNKKGLIDASSGAMHYALRYKEMKTRKKDIEGAKIENTRPAGC